MTPARHQARSPGGPGAGASARAQEESDAHLVVRVLSGETGCYAVLVGRYQATLHRYARGMLRDADLASDVVQDSLVKAYTRLDSCRDASRFQERLRGAL